MTNSSPVSMPACCRSFLALVSVGVAIGCLDFATPTLFGDEPSRVGAEVKPPNGPPLVPTSGPQSGPKSGPSDAKPPTTPGDTKPSSEAAASSELVKRPTTATEAPNKRELDVRPDDSGMVQFQFRNQAWPDVLKWLAETSQMSLDWQELPGDFINLSTQRPYSIVETRDLFNRHLLARGFTLLEIDGMLQVGKTDKINSALVPKVLPEDLDALPPHRFVRCSFSLETLLVEDIVEEFKSLLGINGKLIPLHSTNRLEAIVIAIKNQPQSRGSWVGCDFLIATFGLNN